MNAQKSFLLLFFWTILSSAAQAQGKGTYDFLRLDMNARAAALNGSFVSVTNDPNLLFYNPSALATLEKPSAAVSFVKHLLDVNGGSLTYSQAYEDWGVFGIGIGFIDYGSFDETDASMNILGSFGATELAVSLGWGTVLEENLSIGISTEFIHSSISSYSSSALAMGLGLLYQIPSESIAIGASILHLGTQLQSYAGVRESLPLDISIGITKRPEHVPVLLSLNFHKLNEDHDSFLDRLSAFSFGAEFLLDDSFRIRGGYSNEKKRELKLGSSSGLAGFSFGGGVVIEQYTVDYSFNSYGAIGSLHRISLGTTF